MNMKNKTVTVLGCVVLMSVGCSSAQYQQVNPVRVLGLSIFASSKNIKERCRKLLKNHHLDKGGSDEVAQRITAACDDLDWRGKDSCNTDNLNWGASCACPTTGTSSFCMTGFTLGKTRCNCRLATLDDTVIPDSPVVNNQIPKQNTQSKVEPETQSSQSESEQKKSKFAQENTSYDQSKGRFDQQEEKKDNQQKSGQEHQKTANEQDNNREQHDVPDVPGQKTTFASGLVKEILIPVLLGARQVHANDKVLINYKVWIKEYGHKGRLISASASPSELSVGNDPVVGLNEALLTMKVGQKTRFELPPHLVKGYKGSILVSAKTTLIYEIELISIV